MKKSINKIILSILTIVSVSTLFNTNTTYATTNLTNDSIIKKYDSLTNQINTISNSINRNSNLSNSINNNSNLLNSSYSSNTTLLNEKEVGEIEALKEDLYNLIKDNPDTFGDLIISDEEKMDYLLKNDTSTVSTLASLEKWVNYGDIFVRRPDADGIGNLAGHAGIGDFDKGWTIEANILGSGYEGVRYRNNYSGWKNSKNAKMLRPYGVDEEDYNEATNFAIRQIGSPYNYTFTVAGEGFYCSELVYFAWKTASGLKLRTNTALGENGISPGELADTPLTYGIPWPY